MTHFLPWEDSHTTTETFFEEVVLVWSQMNSGVSLERDPT